MQLPGDHALCCPYGSPSGASSLRLTPLLPSGVCVRRPVWRSLDTRGPAWNPEVRAESSALRCLTRWACCPSGHTWLLFVTCPHPALVLVPGGVAAHRPSGGLHAGSWPPSAARTAFLVPSSFLPSALCLYQLFACFPFYLGSPRGRG